MEYEEEERQRRMKGEISFTKRVQQQHGRKCVATLYERVSLYSLCTYYILVRCLSGSY